VDHRGERRAGGSEPSGRVLACLLGTLATGAMLRAFAFWAFPVIHDETRVMSYGLARIFLSGEIAEFVFRTPATVSNGVTPLWFWIQAGPASVLGETSRLGLRAVPFLLGLVGIGLTFRITLRLHNLRSAWFAALLYAVMGLMLYTNGRGEFAESLIAPLLLCCLHDLHLRQGDRIGWRVTLWPALILLTYLGKGLLVWSGYALVIATFYILGWSDPSLSRPRRATRWFALTWLPLLPSLGWLLAAQAVVFGTGHAVATDIGPVSSIWEGASKLTVGYGTQVKRAMVGPWTDALYVFSDFRVWPTLALIAVPAAATLGGLLLDLAGAASRRDPRSAQAALVPLGLALPPLAAILIKGAVGARFHLLYLPVLLPWVGRALDRWIAMLEEGRGVAFASWGIATVLYAGWAASRVDRFHAAFSFQRFALAAAVGVGVVVAGVAWRRIRPAGRHAGAAVAMALSTLLVASSLAWGPLAWGRRLAWEPEPNRTADPASATAFPTPDLELAQSFVRREVVVDLVHDGVDVRDRAGVARAAARVMNRARPLFLRALKNYPDDRATLVTAGSALLEYGSGDRSLVLESWTSYLRRHPDDRELEAALAAAQRQNR